MQPEPTNNGPNSSDADADLQDVFRREVPAFGQVDIDALLRDATECQSPVSTAEVLDDSGASRRPNRLHDSSSIVTVSRRTIVMLSKVGVVVVCAAGLCVALVHGLWGGNSAFAQVQTALKKIKTASYTVTQTVGDQPAQTWKVELLGESLCRVDQPNGTYLVFDVTGRRMMEVNPAESKVRFTENLPVPMDFNILAMLTDLDHFAAKVQPGVPSREIAGVTAVGFIADVKGEAYYVWIDPKTSLPLELKAERTVPLPDGLGEVRTVKEHWSDFRFDQPCDESRFDLTAPAGFAVETRQAPADNLAERDRALRKLERQKAAIEAAKRKAAEPK